MTNNKKLSDLNFDTKNANKHTAKGQKALEDSLQKYGAGRSILVDKNNNIIAGNLTAEVAGQIGLEDVQIVESDGKKLIVVKRTDIDINSKAGRELAISDNRASELSLNWDSDALKDIQENFKVDLSEFFSNKELKLLGLDNINLNEEDFEFPDEIKTDIILGDLFEIGEHRLLCGDSTDSDSVARLMDGEKADMLTDPPYGIDINMNMGRLKGQPKKFEDKNWDKSVPDFFYLLELFENKIIWGGNYFADKLPISKDWLCWSKKTKGLDFAEFELAWTNTGKNARILEHHWSGEKKLHPTMKPVPVIAWCLHYLHSKNIFDPFLGSGSTMVASHQLNRKCYGMEIDPKYCQVILDRMLKFDPSLKIIKNGKHS